MVNRRGNTARDNIYAYICSFWYDNLLPPSYRAIMSACGISSTSVLKYHLDKMIEDGRLAPRSKQRMIRPARMRVVIDDFDKDDTK